VNPAALLALGGVGVVVGFLSGLIGIGGGVLIVPFLYFFYAHGAFSGTSVAEELVPTVSHATSLFIIVPTALMGTITFSRANLVAWRAAVPIALFSVVAAAAGATIAPRLPADLLTLAFGLLLVFTGIQLWARKARPEGKPLRLKLAFTAPTGILVGLLSAILGVGGGTIAIPILLNVVRLEIQRVAATSLAVVALAAASGTITYVVNGAGLGGRPEGSIGFVHITAALPILLGSMLAVGWGARANQRVNRRTLRWVFGISFMLLGIRMAVGSLLLLFA
jgi:uncharacterized membrane protein YfcA